MLKLTESSHVALQLHNSLAFTTEFMVSNLQSSIEHLTVSLVYAIEAPAW